MTKRAAILFSALCQTVAATGVQASAIALNFEAGKNRQWAQLLPAGPLVAGRDGRSWSLPDPQALVAAFNAHGGPMAIDYEHAIDLAAHAGQPVPAAGWIERLEVRDGQLWGEVEWTERAANAIAAREYRFLSPVFNYRTEDNRIVALEGAALVNRPNLTMAALNFKTNGGPVMDKQIIAALGLKDDATLADVLGAINAQKDNLQTALNSAKTPDVAKFVPRADYDLALNRASEAEGRLATRDRQEKEAEISREVDAAIAAGKIAPSSKEFYLATCAVGDGLERFKTFIAGATSVFAKSGLDEKKPNEAGKTALNASEKEVCRAMGLAEDDFIKNRAA